MRAKHVRKNTLKYVKQTILKYPFPGYNRTSLIEMLMVGLSVDWSVLLLIGLSYC